MVGREQLEKLVYAAVDEAVRSGRPAVPCIIDALEKVLQQPPVPAPLPPCGPERDRLAAEAVGWMHWDCSWPWHPQRMQYLAPSTTDADALALLEAWATTTAAATRGYGHNRYEGAGHVVTLFKNGNPVAWANAPTLGDAATAAVIHAERGSA